ncbi:MAG: O-succinylhomoserine sulfhydrylase, partial [Thiohalomonadaceae bacterium]
MTISRDDWDDLGFDTLAVRAGQVRTSEGEQSEPIFPTSSFTFESAAQAAARFGGTEPGNIYSRFTNPTVRTFEQRLAALEGGESCVATSSGMAAILSTCMGLLKAGDHIVSSRAIFGTTTVLFNNFMAKFGVEISYVDQTDYVGWEQALRPNTRFLFLETPSNPLTEVADIPRLAELAHAHGALLVVDNCFCTPALQQPLKLGADVVIHSATKYIDGQGRAMGGAVVGNAELVGNQVYSFLRSAGPTMSTFNAWIFLKGLETLKLRMRAHCENALALAQWLEQQPGVAHVHYPGLASHPQHELASSQQTGFGGILSFELEGGQTQAWKVIDGTRVMSITANLGDTKTTITHPATT